MKRSTHLVDLCCERPWPGCAALRTWLGPRGRSRGPAAPSSWADPSPGAARHGCIGRTGRKDIVSLHLLALMSGRMHSGMDEVDKRKRMDRKHNKKIHYCISIRCYSDSSFFAMYKPIHAEIVPLFQCFNILKYKTHILYDCHHPGGRSSRGIYYSDPM